MTTSELLIKECDRREIALEHAGKILRVTPVDRTTPELMEKLRQHKWEILSVLESRKRDAARHLAKQILFHEFDGCDDSTRRTLAAVLRAFQCPLTRRARAALKNQRRQNPQ